MSNSGFENHATTFDAYHLPFENKLFNFPPTILLQSGPRSPSKASELDSEVSKRRNIINILLWGHTIRRLAAPNPPTSPGSMDV